MSGQIDKMSDQNEEFWKETGPLKEEKLFPALQSVWF